MGPEPAKEKKSKDGKKDLLWKPKTNTNWVALQRFRFLDKAMEFPKAKEKLDRLLDAEILADVYLLMTGGQTMLHLATEESSAEARESAHGKLTGVPGPLPLTMPDDEELQAHARFLERIHKSSKSKCIWLNSSSQQSSTDIA